MVYTLHLGSKLLSNMTKQLVSGISVELFSSPKKARGTYQESYTQKARGTYQESYTQKARGTYQESYTQKMSQTLFQSLSEQGICVSKVFW